MVKMDFLACTQTPQHIFERRKFSGDANSFKDDKSTISIVFMRWKLAQFFFFILDYFVKQWEML